MNRSKTEAAVRALLIATLILGSCSNRDLRGTWVPSKDGNTYLVIADDNGWPEGPLLVDGKTWPYAKGSPGQIQPGVHSISCCGGAEIGFRVPPKVVYSFTYWGP